MWLCGMYSVYLRIPFQTLLSLSFLRHETPAEGPSNNSEAVIRIMHLVDEEIMPVCQTSLAPSHFADD
jgi:hypothetical protein